MSDYDYYDAVLGLIPVSMAVITGGLLLAGLATTTAVPIGAGTAALVVGHALFVNGPTSAQTPAPVSTAPSSSGPGVTETGATPGMAPAQAD
jgi:hypothetical protein